MLRSQHYIPIMQPTRGHSKLNGYPIVADPFFELVSLIHKNFSTRSVFYSKYKDLFKLKTRIGKYLPDFSSPLN